MNVTIGRPILRRQPHLQQRLAIALRVGAAEVAGRALGQVLPLLVADEHDLVLIEVGQPGDDRLVVADGPVAVQLEELLEDQLDVVAGLGAPLDAARPARSARGPVASRSRASARPARGAAGGSARRSWSCRPPMRFLAYWRLHLGEPRLHLVDRRFEGEPRFAGTGHRGGVLDQDRADGTGIRYGRIPGLGRSDRRGDPRQRRHEKPWHRGPPSGRGRP